MTLQSWLEENPFTLALSSGFFGFYAHAGFLKALEERGLSPSGFTGSSAGAIVVAAAARGLRAQEIEKLILSVKLEDFWDPRPGLGLVRGKKFENLLEKEIGRDFSELAKPVKLATFDIFKRKTVTFETGALARIIRASCAVPLMFHPVYIDGRLYWDGGVLDKMAVAGIPETERVLIHYLDGSNVYERYEKNRDGIDRAAGRNTAAPEKAKRQIVALQKLARSSPRKMHLGPEIVEAAYRQTLERLSAPLA